MKQLPFVLDVLPAKVFQHGINAMLFQINTVRGDFYYERCGYIVGLLVVMVVLLATTIGRTMVMLLLLLLPDRIRHDGYREYLEEEDIAVARRV
jgi:hypothetical protein